MLIVPLAHVLGQYMCGSAGLVVFIKMVGCSALALPICWVNRAFRQQQITVFPPPPGAPPPPPPPPPTPPPPPPGGGGGEVDHLGQVCLPVFSSQPQAPLWDMRASILSASATTAREAPLDS
jgi:hypothetical protein